MAQWDTGVAVPPVRPYSGSNRELDPMERAFIERVFREDPQCADRIAALIYSQHPDLRH
jgi:hypothetical protein